MDTRRLGLNSVMSTACALALAACSTAAPVSTVTPANTPQSTIHSVASPTPRPTAASEPATPTASPASPASPSAGATPFPHSAIELDHKPGIPLVAFGSVWVPSFAGGVVMRLDPATNAVIASIDVGGRPSEYGLLAHGDGVWVPVGECSSDDPYSCTDGFLAHIDPARDEVIETIPLRTWGYSIAGHGDTLWVSSFLGNRVVRVRVALGVREIVSEVRVVEPTGIVAGPEGAWTPRHFTGLLVHIDAETNESEEIDLGTAATEFVAIEDDHVWVTSGENSHEITVVSRETKQVVDRIAAGWPQGIVVEDGVVWVAATGTDDPPGLGPKVLAIDSSTREIIGDFPFPPENGPWGLTTDAEQVWVVGGEELFVFDAGG